jgi:hypothetical protein
MMQQALNYDERARQISAMTALSQKYPELRGMEQSPAAMQNYAAAGAERRVQELHPYEVEKERLNTAALQAKQNEAKKKMMRDLEQIRWIKGAQYLSAGDPRLAEEFMQEFMPGIMLDIDENKNIVMGHVNDPASQQVMSQKDFHNNIYSKLSMKNFIQQQEAERELALTQREGEMDIAASVAPEIYKGAAQAQTGAEYAQRLKTADQALQDILKRIGGPRGAAPVSPGESNTGAAATKRQVRETSDQSRLHEIATDPVKYNQALVAIQNSNLLPEQQMQLTMQLKQAADSAYGKTGSTSNPELTTGKHPQGYGSVSTMGGETVEVDGQQRIPDGGMLPASSRPTERDWQRQVYNRQNELGPMSRFNPQQGGEGFVPEGGMAVPPDLGGIPQLPQATPEEILNSNIPDPQKQILLQMIAQQAQGRQVAPIPGAPVPTVPGQQPMVGGMTGPPSSTYRPQPSGPEPMSAGMDWQTMGAQPRQPQPSGPEPMSAGMDFQTVGAPQVPRQGEPGYENLPLEAKLQQHQPFRQGLAQGVQDIARIARYGPQNADEMKLRMKELVDMTRQGIEISEYEQRWLATMLKTPEGMESYIEVLSIAFPEEAAALRAEQGQQPLNQKKK